MRHVPTRNTVTAGYHKISLQGDKLQGMTIIMNKRETLMLETTKEKDEKSKKKMKVTDISHIRKQVLKSKAKAILKPKKVIGPNPDIAVAHKPINIPKQLSQPIFSLQSMMSRLLTCTNLIQVNRVLLKFNFNQFVDVTGSFKHITKTDKIDQVAFWCIPTDALSGSLPVDVVGDCNCCPRSFTFALFGTEEYHREFRLLFLREDLFN